MDKNSEKNVRFRINITLLIAVVLLVADLYAMINMPQKFIILAIITALFLVAIYFLVDSISIYLMAEKNRKEEQYDSIFKSEKASYLLLRKTFDDLYELIEKGNQSRKANVEDIIHAQKAVAKVSIGRSKENADALMNSNDHIMEKISMLEAVLSDNVSHPAPETNKNDSAYAQNILDNQNKILQQLEVLQNTFVFQNRMRFHLMTVCHSNREHYSQQSLQNRTFLPRNVSWQKRIKLKKKNLL